MSLSLEQRIARVEDRQAIQQLTATYCFAIDDRDLDTVGRLFSTHAHFGSHDGAMSAHGREAIVEQFRSRFSVLGTSNHVAHNQVIHLDSDTRAHGLVSSHAEVWRLERTMLTALRYTDQYEKVDGEWCFAERLLSFMYYVPVEEYASAMGRLDRNRAGPTPMPADWPEGRPTWTEYRPAYLKQA
jgi:SnoaL-like domain